jgi:cell division protease FtsH
MMTEDPSHQKADADAGEATASSPTTSPSAQPAGGDAAAVAEVPAGESTPATGVADERVSRWSELRRACEEEANIDDEDGAKDGEAMPLKTQSANNALLLAALSAAVTPDLEAKLLTLDAIALVVSIPSSGLMKPLKKYFDNGGLGRSWQSYARDGSERRFDKPSVGNDTVATGLASGQSVVGIATDPDSMLPATLIAAADARLTIRFDAKVVRSAIGKMFGEDVPSIDDPDLVGLEFYDFEAAMRPGSNAREVVARISAAAKSRAGKVDNEDVPDLASAVEYGAARDWGLALARDMREFRAGRLPWTAVDRGAIFHSAPGMGKSVLARSLALACGANLVAGSIGETFATSSGNLDGVIKAMRELFAKAIAAAPSILFLDEIDAMPSRDSLGSRNADWWMPVITDFLLLLDDATSRKREGVVVIGATNRIHAVDPAVLRPGRLERSIEIVPPGRDGIINILRFHVRKDLPDEQLGSIADLIEGLTPAEIMETVRRARRNARHKARGLSIDDLKNAALPEMDVSSNTLYRIAVHEAGHVASALFGGVGRVNSVRIGGRSGIGGVTNMVFGSDDLITRSVVEDRVTSLLSGRAAEIVLLGAASTGAGGDTSSDLARATRILAAMEMSYGLADERLVYLVAAEDAHAELRKDPMARRRTDELMRRLQERAVTIVREHRSEVAAIADALVSRRFLSADEIEAVVARSKVLTEDELHADAPGRPS